MASASSRTNARLTRSPSLSKGTILRDVGSSEALWNFSRLHFLRNHIRRRGRGIGRSGSLRRRQDQYLVDQQAESDPITWVFWRYLVPSSSERRRGDRNKSWGSVLRVQTNYSSQRTWPLRSSSALVIVIWIFQGGELELNWAILRNKAMEAALVSKVGQISVSLQDQGV
jgi:hypothetical protein